MPKNQVSDPITDQEIAFARLVLSGTMHDRAAAQAVGLNPDTAAYTKAKPRVRAYMLEHRAAVQQQLVEQEAEGLRRKNLWRQQVLDRLWEIAKLPAESTRGSITGQVKAISMIVAIEGLIPDRRAGSSGKKFAPPLPDAEVYPAVGLHQQQAQPGPQVAQEEDDPNPSEPSTPGWAEEATPAPGIPSSPTFDHHELVSAPDTRVPFSIKKNPFARRH